MTIKNFELEPDFSVKLHQYISASSAIKSIEHLKGRETQSQLIERTLRSPGRSVFIYGDRGVGKTSLAQTSAYRFNSSLGAPLIIGVDSSSTFFSIIHDLCSKIAGLRPDLISKTNNFGASAGYKGLSIEIGKEIETGTVPPPKSINEAIPLIEFFFPNDESDSVVVIDEFERFENAKDRALFADFIKQIGDQELSLKFIFCGVADALDELLASHHSCYRYLETIALERLEWPARAEIIEATANAFNVVLPEEIVWRITAISDGFPYYIHIVCEKLFWRMFDHEDQITTCTNDIYKNAVNDAVTTIEPTLKITYEGATKKYNNDYEEVLWATADHNNLERRSSEIMDSYTRIMSERKTPAMTRSQFNNRINALKKPSHHSILVGTRSGWYRFSENVIRGYVRLRAEQDGVALDIRDEKDFTDEVAPKRAARETLEDLT